MSEKRKKPSYYQYKKHKKFVLEAGLKGFLCSCNSREKDCIRESYNILNKYADVLYAKTEEESAHGDIEDDLECEVKKLKSLNSDATKRFQVVESGAKNFLFIRTSLDDPVQLAEAIATDLDKTKDLQTRFLLRLVPIELVCKAYLDDIKVAIEPLLLRHFAGSPKTFSVVFNHRNNNNLSRDEVIKAVAQAVGEKHVEHKVNLMEPELSVVIEVIKGFALIAVIPYFLKFKKYNLHMICGYNEFEKKEVKEDALEVAEKQTEDSEDVAA